MKNIMLFSLYASLSIFSTYALGCSPGSQCGYNPNLVHNVNIDVKLTGNIQPNQQIFYSVYNNSTKTLTTKNQVAQLTNNEFNFTLNGDLLNNMQVSYTYQKSNSWTITIYGTRYGHNDIAYSFQVDLSNTNVSITQDITNGWGIFYAAGTGGYKVTADAGLQGNITINASNNGQPTCAGYDKAYYYEEDEGNDMNGDPTPNMVLTETVQVQLPYVLSTFERTGLQPYIWQKSYTYTYGDGNLADLLIKPVPGCSNLTPLNSSVKATASR